MPESFTSLPEARCSALEKFFSNLDLESVKDQCQGQRMAPIHTTFGNPGGDQHPLVLAPSNIVQTSPVTSDNNIGRTTRPRGRGGARTNPRPKKIPIQKRTGRKPGTSKYYGVRFRPDLRKWVAEIRVQEWKSVDKKVWLGTFDTEQAAARGVDLARKLLKCKKKHRPNLPCSKLTAYSNHIPTRLILTELETPEMFRSTTRFIKQECKEYAASFDNDDNNESLTAAAQLNLPNPQSSTNAGMPFFNETLKGRYDFINTGVNIFDLVESSESEPSGLIQYCGDLASIHDQHISVHCSTLGQDWTVNTSKEGCGIGERSGMDLSTLRELEVDSYSTMTSTYSSSFGLGMSSSSTSAASCVTLEALQQVQEYPVLGWESNDIGCEDGEMSETMPDLMNCVSMMESTLAVDMDAGAASQMWAEDASLFRAWPEDPSDCPSGYLPEFPDALSGLTSHVSPLPGSGIAPLDLEPWSLQGAHNPLYGLYEWL